MITAVLIGAGGRGLGAYGNFALKNPEDLKFVAVADPDQERRMAFAKMHQIDESLCFNNYDELLSVNQLADTCFVCTQDHMHVDPTVKALKKGYHVFLEKPMAITPADCILLEETANHYHKKLMIGHVLRYTLFFDQIKQLIDSGKIGKLMTIQHNENVSYWHQAHSYVRGNWRNKELSSPMILAKSCHDLDILLWLANSKPKKISSYGSLSYFKEENKPEGAPKYCMDGCPKQDECVYYAPKMYLQGADWLRFPVASDMTDESVLNNLKKGPYGRCVFQCDNDVVDHQVVILEFENEMTASFTMTAFTHEITRTIKVMGTLGEIRGHMDKNEIELYTFGVDQPEVFHLDIKDYGHSGGDYGIMKAFVRYIEKGDNEAVCNAFDSVTSHLLAFAAEESRITSHSIAFDEFYERTKANVDL